MGLRNPVSRVSHCNTPQHTDIVYTMSVYTSLYLYTNHYVLSYLYTDVYRFIQVYTGVYRCIQMYTDVYRWYRCIQMYTHHYIWSVSKWLYCLHLRNYVLYRGVVDTSHCNTLQHTATHCNTLQHTATYCLTLLRTATHCNTLQHTATHCNKEVPSRRSLVSHYMGSQLAFCSWKETCNWRHPVHLEIHRIPSVARLLYWSLVSHYRCIGCLKLHVTFDERAAKHRALLRKITYKDKAFYDSTPPCSTSSRGQTFENGSSHTVTYCDTLWHAATTYVQSRADSWEWQRILQRTATQCDKL